MGYKNAFEKHTAEVEHLILSKTDILGRATCVLILSSLLTAITNGFGRQS